MPSDYWELKIFENDYYGDYSFMKIVSKKDAYNWATALRKHIAKLKEQNILEISTKGPTIFSGPGERASIDLGETIPLEEVEELCTFFEEDGFGFWSND